ncbi:Hypothetical predicted protein, partial [Pelobates cultripes]
MAIHIPQAQLTILQSKYNFKWRKYHHMFLGIAFTKHIDKLFQGNYGKTQIELQSLMQDWKKLYVSWSGRIAATKMVILHKIQYLFRSLPIHIPNSYFTKLHNNISKFIWMGKRAKVALHTLHCPLSEGGMSLPNLKAYSHAAIMNNIVHKQTAQHNLQWSTIEKQWTKGIERHHVAWLPRPPNQDWLPTTSLTLKVWDQFKQNLTSTAPLSRATPIQAFSLIIEDFNYKIWERPRRVLSTIYRSMHKKAKIKEYTFVKAWEKELKKTLSEDTWEIIFTEHQKLTLCASHRELSKKIMYRWYLVPTRLAHISPSKSNKCWRCNTEVGIITHFLA